MDFRKIMPIFAIIFIFGVSIICTHSAYAASSLEHTTKIKINSVGVRQLLDWSLIYPPFSKFTIDKYMIAPRLYIESDLYVDGKYKSGELIDYRLYNSKNEKIAEDWDKTGTILSAIGIFNIKDLPIGDYTIVASYNGDLNKEWPSTHESYNFYIMA